jgi:hypothetical protein
VNTRLQSHCQSISAADLKFPRHHGKFDPELQIGDTPSTPARRSELASEEPRHQRVVLMRFPWSSFHFAPGPVADKAAVQASHGAGRTAAIRFHVKSPMSPRLPTMSRLGQQSLQQICLH